jgi:hypothetical protein
VRACTYTHVAALRPAQQALTTRDVHKLKLKNFKAIALIMMRKLLTTVGFDLLRRCGSDAHENDAVHVWRCMRTCWLGTGGHAAQQHNFGVLPASASANSGASDVVSRLPICNHVSGVGGSAHYIRYVKGSQLPQFLDETSDCFNAAIPL